MPFPSAGCQTCKIRRIKCDETQPVCQRCMRSQRTCYGMRDNQAGSVLHSENSYASGQKKRPRGPRSTRTLGYTVKLDAFLQPPLVDLKSQAVAYYLHDHLQTLEDTPNIFKTVSGDFLPMSMSRAECPMLDLAISSIALAVFSQTQKHPPAAVEASIRYQKLLRIAQITIPSLNEGNVDACLLAIFFMSRYEDVVYRPNCLNRNTPFATTLQSFSHHDGALAILRIWKKHLSRSQPSTDIIKHTRRGLIRSALLRGLALPEWMVEGSSFGERGLELEYDCIVGRIANIRQRLSTLFKEKTSPRRTSHELVSIIEELSKEAEDIDNALQDWRARFPSTWVYQRRHTLSNSHLWPTKDFYSPVVYSYSSPACAAVWSLYYSMRMLISSTRLRVLKLGNQSVDDHTFKQRIECLSQIKTMGNDLASSVPFCLHRFTVTESPNSSSHQGSVTLNTKVVMKPYMANLAVWPLSIASSLEDVDAEQKLWFKSELAHLGRITGVGMLECTENDSWLKI